MFNIRSKPPKFQMRKKNLRFGVTLMAFLSICMGVIFVSQLNAQEIIDPHSGLMVLTTTDLLVNAGAINLEVQRSLQFRHSYKGLLGAGWQMNWETRLYPLADFVLIEENGQLIRFDPEASAERYHSNFGEDLIFDVNRQATRHGSDGTKETFDPQGRLVERDLGNGNKVFLRYDDAGRLARIDGPKGSFLKFELDQGGHVIRVDSSRGRSIKYGYTDGRLTQVQVNKGYAIGYTYSPNGDLIKIDDPQTGAVEFAYDAKGRVISRRWADGSEERYEYDDEKNIRRHIDAGGNATTSRWSDSNRLVEITDALGNQTTIEYEGSGQMTKISGPAGVIAQMTYDDQGRIATVTDPAGKTTQLEYVKDSSLVKRITRPNCTAQVFEYDQNRNLIRLKSGATIVSEFSYHPDGLLAEVREAGTQKMNFTYFPDGNLKSINNALGETTRFEYDARGNLVREINPLGGMTQYAYDLQDRLVSETDSEGRTTRYEYDGSGRLSRLIDPGGSPSRYEYDARGQVVTETDPAGRTTRYKYDSAGDLVNVTLPGGGTERFQYDAAGNMLEWSDSLKQVTSYRYDSFGRRIGENHAAGLELNYRYDTLGNLSHTADNTGAKESYERDACGRLTARVDSRGGITRYQYDLLGNLLQVIDPHNQVKRFAYTAEGQISSAREPTGDEVRYAYDLAGRLVKIHQPGGGTVSFNYDAMGNVIAEIDSLKNQNLYSYDLAGRLVSATDPMGMTTRFSYDGNDRLVNERLPDGGQITYRYDAGGDLIEADDGHYPVRYSYDSQGRLERTVYPRINKTVSYEYDTLGLQTKLIAPQGYEIRYEYNDRKQLAGMILPDGQSINFTYDLKERLESIHYPNGIVGSWQYDAAGQITAIRYQDRNKKTVAGWAYRYDAARNLVEQKDHIGQITHFSYDPAGQLTEERESANTIRYQYLPGGNRAQLEVNGLVTKYHYDTADRLIQRGSEKLAYNENGGLISRKTADGKTLYEYDAKDRLSKVVGPDGASTTYGYTPTGERIWKKDADGLTYYLYDGLDLLQEIGETGKSKVSYLHAPGIDRPLAMIRDGKIYYYHPDRLGSIRHLTDDQGKIAATYDYDAFGNFKTREATVPNPFTFTARELDQTTGLYYFRARYYDASIGRFLTTDPVPADMDDPLEHNPYLYASNNPLSFTDPLGLFEVSIDYNWFTLQELKGLYTTAVAEGRWGAVLKLEKALEHARKSRVTIQTRLPIKSPQVVPTRGHVPGESGIQMFPPTRLQQLRFNYWRAKGWFRQTRPGEWVNTQQFKNYVRYLRAKAWLASTRLGKWMASTKPTAGPPSSSIIGGATRPINTGAAPPPASTVALRPGLSQAAKAGFGAAAGVTVIGNAAACIIEGGSALRCGGEIVGTLVAGKILLTAIPALATPGGVIVLGTVGVVQAGSRLKQAIENRAQRQKEIEEFEANRNTYCIAKIKEPQDRIKELFNASSKMPGIFETMEAPKAAQAQFALLQSSKEQATSRLGQLEALLALIQHTARKCDQLQNQIVTAKNKATEAKNQAARHTENAFEAASICQDEKDAEKIVQEYNQARSMIYKSEEHAQSINEPAEEMRSQSEVITQAREKARSAIDDISKILSSDEAQYSTVFKKVKAAKDQWAELDNEIKRERVAIEDLINTRLAYCFDAPEARVEFEALKIELKAAAQIDNNAINSISGMLPEAEKLTSDLGNIRQKNNAIARDFTGGKSTCDLSESFVEMVAQIPKATRKRLASMVPYLRERKQECNSPSEEAGETQAETEDDPTEDDEWARGGSQRARSTITTASTPGGQITGRYSKETLGAVQKMPRKPAGGKSKTSSQGSTPAVVTSLPPSSSTTEPASGPATGEPGSPDPSSEKEPGETEESASPPPSLTNTDWVIAYGDIFFFIMRESSSGELTGCIRQRGGAMGICDEKIGTRSGKQVTFKEASYLGGATWNLQLSSDGKEMNGTQTTKEYGTREVRVLRE
jgi:RHS repeat-associated protein